jgi:hypothetical protein
LLVVVDALVAGAATSLVGEDDFDAREEEGTTTSWMTEGEAMTARELDDGWMGLGAAALEVVGTTAMGVWETTAEERGSSAAMEEKTSSTLEEMKVAEETAATAEAVVAIVEVCCWLVWKSIWLDWEVQQTEERRKGGTHGDDLSAVRGCGSAGSRYRSVIRRDASLALWKGKTRRGVERSA